MEKHMKTIRKRRIGATMLAIVLAAAIIVSGTLAWQVITQRAINRVDAINDGPGRVHDDFCAESGNKDVFAENYSTTESLWVRIRLSEFMSVNGVPFAPNTSIDYPLGNATYNPWTTHIPLVGQPENNASVSGGREFRDYVSWNMGGQKWFMPTHNHDSACSQTVASGDGIDFTTGGQTALGGNDGTENFWGQGDTHTNTLRRPNGQQTANVTHTAQQTLPHVQDVITMSQWIAGVPALNIDPMQNGPFWVVDYDGWAYWAELLPPGEATSLLLDHIHFTPGNDGTHWSYAIFVEGEFATAYSWEQAWPDLTPEAEELIRQVSIRVTYNANGGTGAVPVDRIFYRRGDTVTALSSTLTKRGFEQVGWRINDPTTGTLIAMNGTFTVQADTTLYAEWELGGPTFFRLRYLNTNLTLGAAADAARPTEGSLTSAHGTVSREMTINVATPLPGAPGLHRFSASAALALPSDWVLTGDGINGTITGEDAGIFYITATHMHRRSYEMPTQPVSLLAKTYVHYAVPFSGGYVVMIAPGFTGTFTVTVGELYTVTFNVAANRSVDTAVSLGDTFMDGGVMWRLVDFGPNGERLIVTEHIHDEPVNYGAPHVRAPFYVSSIAIHVNNWFTANTTSALRAMALPHLYRFNDGTIGGNGLEHQGERPATNQLGYVSPQGFTIPGAPGVYQNNVSPYAFIMSGSEGSRFGAGRSARSARVVNANGEGLRYGFYWIRTYGSLNSNAPYIIGGSNGMGYTANSNVFANMFPGTYTDCLETGRTALFEPGFRIRPAVWITAAP